MRQLSWTALLLLGTLAGCGGDTSVSLDGEGDTGAVITDVDEVGESSDADNDASEEALEPEPCVVQPWMCPNACEHGPLGEGDICVTDVDCGCGLFCDFGGCVPMTGVDEGCRCVGDPPPGETQSGAEEFEPIAYSDSGCVSATPSNSTCNPYCQLGCPLGTHCTLVPEPVEEARFACLAIGEGTRGAICTDGTECAENHSCFKPFDADEATCMTTCDEDADCGKNFLCTLNLDFNFTFGTTFCEPAPTLCNLWLQDCPGTDKCVISQGETICTPNTFDGIDGYPCDELGDCAPGLICTILGCKIVCSTAENPPQGAPSCNDACPAGAQPVSLALEVGRCE